MFARCSCTASTIEITRGLIPASWVKSAVFLFELSELPSPGIEITKRFWRGRPILSKTWQQTKNAMEESAPPLRPKTSFSDLIWRIRPISPAVWISKARSSCASCSRVSKNGSRLSRAFSGVKTTPADWLWGSNGYTLLSKVSSLSCSSKVPSCQIWQSPEKTSSPVDSVAPAEHIARSPLFWLENCWKLAW